MRIQAPPPGSSGSFRLPNPGKYTATLESWENLGLQPNPFGPDKEKLKMVFDLGDNLKQWYWAAPSLHPSSKFYAMACALLAALPGESLEVDDLVGLQCEVEVDHYKSNDGKVRSKIVDFRSLGKITHGSSNHTQKVLNTPPPVNQHGVAVTDDDIPF